MHVEEYDRSRAGRAKQSAALAFLGLLGVGVATSARTQSAPSTSEIALRHRSAAAAYLRTGNTDLAIIEMEALRGALSGPSRRLADDAIAAAERGDHAAASLAIAQIRSQAAAERRRAGVRILADCVGEAEARLAAVTDGRSIDLAEAAARQALAERAVAAARALAVCDAEASRDIAALPAWRRLIEGATASLVQLPAAIDRRDADLLHRLVIELRSFERLLVQRFG